MEYRNLPPGKKCVPGYPPGSIHKTFRIKDFDFEKSTFFESEVFEKELWRGRTTVLNINLNKQQVYWRAPAKQTVSWRHESDNMRNVSNIILIAIGAMGLICSGFVYVEMNAADTIRQDIIQANPHIYNNIEHGFWDAPRIMLGLLFVIKCVILVVVPITQWKKSK